jgi:hypothetical protein
VVPFNYLSLVWAMILRFAVWGDVPTLGLLVGSAIVVGSVFTSCGARPCTAARKALRAWGSLAHLAPGLPKMVAVL